MKLKQTGLEHIKCGSIEIALLIAQIYHSHGYHLEDNITLSTILKYRNSFSAIKPTLRICHVNKRVSRQRDDHQNHPFAPLINNLNDLTILFEDNITVAGLTVRKGDATIQIGDFIMSKENAVKIANFITKE